MPARRDVESMRLTGASVEAISWPPSPHAKSALGQCPGFIAGQTYSGRVARERDERGFQSMWRQLGALLLVLALVFGATYFLGISVVARSNFAFDTSDVLSSAAGMWFAPNIVVSVLSGMAGACVGVFVRRGQRRSEESAA